MGTAGDRGKAKPYAGLVCRNPALTARCAPANGRDRKNKDDAMPMILRSSPTSPFGRKVKLALHVAGLTDQVAVENADTMKADDTLRVQNPLGKIPVLILEDGMTIYDSRVILEAIDQMAGGGKILPRNKTKRLAALTLQSLGDGIMDAGILQRYEIVFRAEDRREATWIAHQKGKVDRALAHLEAKPPKVGVDAGSITLACALGYLDFRFDGLWRKKHKKLARWLDKFAAQMPDVWEKTKPPV